MSLPGQRRVPTQVPDPGPLRVALLRVHQRCIRIAVASRAIALADEVRIFGQGDDFSARRLIETHHAFHQLIAESTGVGADLAARALADDRDIVELLTWAGGLGAAMTERFQCLLVRAHEGVTEPSPTVQALYAELIDAAAIIVASLRSLEHMVLGAVGVATDPEDEG